MYNIYNNNNNNNNHNNNNILPANDLVRCGHTLENHTPMS